MTEEERRQLKLYCFERKIIGSQVFADEFIKKVKLAFANNEYPGDENLISDSEHLAKCDECREYYDFFVGETWQDCLRIDSYRKLTGGQSFFKPLAWHYYLPAYLIQCIYHSHFSDFQFRASNISDCIDEDFSETDFIEFWNRFEQPRIDLLTSRQCQTIIDYLEITEKTQESVDEFYLEYTQKSLNYWRENYQKAVLKEQNFNE